MKLFFLFFFGVSAVLGQSASSPKDIPTIAKESNGVIVSIITSDKDSRPLAQGSGFIVSKDGRIVTNYHVIKNASSAIVKLPDGAFYAVAGVIAFDKNRDIAIIKADGKNFRTAILGNSDRVQVGESVVAIGSPLALESTVSNGIVSAVRNISEQEGSLIQITAPISPGSSGGPLFNMSGEVVGITSAFLSGGESLNFAIPINDAKRLLVPNSKVRDFPVETDSRPTKEPEPASDSAQMTTDSLTGQFGGIVHNTTASASAEFWIIVNDKHGAVTGCMGVLQPLFGSGALTGVVRGTDVAVVVTSPIGKITLLGERQGSEITGHYIVVRPGSPDQKGTFTLHRAKSEGLPDAFDLANCPTDAEVHK